MSIKLRKVLFSGLTNINVTGAIKYKSGRLSDEAIANATNYPGYYGFGVYGNPALNDWAASLPFLGYLALRYPDPVLYFPPPYSWADFRTDPNIYKPVDQSQSGSDDTYSARNVQYLEVQNSSNTIGWPGPKGSRVGGLALTKSKAPINRPKEPVYLKPKLLSVRKPRKQPPVELHINPPSRLGGEGVAAYQFRYDKWISDKSRKEARLTLLAERKYFHRLEKYKVDLATNESRTKRSKENFSKALQNYRVKLQRYNESVRRSKELAYRKAQIHPEGIPQDNPYGLIKMAFKENPTYFEMTGDTIYATANNITGSQGAGIYNTPEFWDFWYTSFLVYRTKTLTSVTPVADLVQYGESIRNLILTTVDPFLVQHDEKLRRKIHQKLKNQTVHVGNIIAERKQTMDLVQSSVKRILALIKAKRNIFKAAASYAKNAKQIASDILAFKFGVEPLMNDIKSFAKYLDEGSDEPIITVRVNTGKSQALPIKVVTASFTFVGFAEISYTVKCVVDNPASRTLSEFGLINPLEILWEVTPWSFVVDWFFPVGDWLSNKTSDCGIVFKTGTRKVRLVGSFTTSGSQTGLPPDSSASLSATSTLVDFDGEVVGRTVLTDIPNLPPICIKNPLSWSHGIESVALAVQKLKIR